MLGKDDSFLRKQAWDYFTTHASQRIATFNFYIVLSSLIATTYFSTFKTDAAMRPARPFLSALLCLFAFIFWKLDQRNRQLIKNAERALKCFERMEEADALLKVFTQEESETAANKSRGLRQLLLWQLPLSYSDCFNLVFLIFFLVGLAGLVGWPLPR
jgi:hypothetical protein